MMVTIFELRTGVLPKDLHCRILLFIKEELILTINISAEVFRKVIGLLDVNEEIDSLPFQILRLIWNEIFIDL